MVIENFNHNKFGSGLLRGGMILPNNTGGIGWYDGTSVYYEIVYDVIDDLRSLFTDCDVKLNNGTLIIDWS